MLRQRRRNCLPEGYSGAGREGGLLSARHGLTLAFEIVFEEDGKVEPINPNDGEQVTENGSKVIEKVIATDNSLSSKSIFSWLP